MTTTKLDQVTDNALHAFWQEVVRGYPQAETGELSPLIVFQLHTVAKEAIEEWVWANVPDADM